MKNTIPTPFPTSGYYGPNYFCDRESEIQNLLNDINGGISTTVVSIRRMGKTGLIKHLQNKVSKDFISVYTDILPTENSVDLVNSMASAIVNAVPAKSKLNTKIWDFLRSMRPVISYDSLTGTPNISFNIQSRESENHIESLLLFLENQQRPVLFAIDEFQQILNYPEKNVDAWLRKIIQQLNNVTFIFSGSQQHVMNDLFTNPKKPFYRSTSLLRLNKINFTTYQQFIQQKFAENKKEISAEIIAEMLHWANVHTYYVQLICNRVFVSSGKKINSETWKQEAVKILKEQEYIFYSYRDLLSKQQWKLLKAIATEGEVFAPTSKEFVQKFNLGSPATVTRSLAALQKKELAFKDYNEEGNLFYSIYDVLFQRWIQNQ